MCKTGQVLATGSEGDTQMVLPPYPRCLMTLLSPATVAAVFFMLAGCATEAAPVEVTSPSPVTTVVPPREIEPPAPALQAGPQTGGVYCELRDKLLKKLEEKFVERPIGMGVNTVGTLVEVRASEDGRTWSIIGTRPNGWSCVVTSGKEWRMMSSPSEASPHTVQGEMLGAADCIATGDTTNANCQ